MNSFELCPTCKGDGWVEGIEHEPQCYKDGDCSCSGVQVQVVCGTCAGKGKP